MLAAAPLTVVDGVKIQPIGRVGLPPGWSEQVAPVWDPVLGQMTEPIPGKLTQSPYGLVAASDGWFGVGLTTDEARWDAFTAMFREQNALGARSGVGTSSAHAVTDLAQRVIADDAATLVGTSDALWTLGAGARKSYARLTLEYGQSAKLTLASTVGGLWHCIVTVGNTSTAWSATTSDTAAETALERMNAIVTLRNEQPDTESAYADRLATVGEDPALLAVTDTLLPGGLRIRRVEPLGLWIAEASAR